MEIGREWSSPGGIESSPEVSACNVQRNASSVEMRRIPESS